MRKLFHDINLQTEFEKNGYVVIDFVSSEIIEEINKTFESLSPDDKFNPEKNRYHCTFIDTNVEYKKKANELFKKHCESPLKNTLIDYKILTGNFYVKQPGCGEFEIHQNWNLLDETLHTSVTIWIPLQDTNELNGTLEIVAGSNKIVENISTLHVPYFFKSLNLN